MNSTRNSSPSTRITSAPTRMDDTSRSSRSSAVTWESSRMSSVPPTPKSGRRTARIDDVSDHDNHHDHPASSAVDSAGYQSMPPPLPEARHASPNKKVVSPSRPTFVLGREKSIVPARPAFFRQPTPYHLPADAKDGDDHSVVTEEPEFVTPRELMEQLEHFLEGLGDELGSDILRKYINPSDIYQLHVNNASVSPSGRVFGVPVSVACATAPCVAFFAGQKQRLPLLVFSVVEELYAREAPGLLRSTGDRRKIDRLVRKFSKDPYGEDYPVDQEAIADLCGLLKEFLDHLPEPIIHPVIQKAFSSLVVGVEAARVAPEKRLHIGQLLLRLLPSPNLSLLVYLLSFLSHIQETKQGNIPALAQLFGKSIAARPIDGEKENAKRARRDAQEDGEDVVKWLLANWSEMVGGMMEEPVLALNPFERNEPVFPHPHSASSSTCSSQHRSPTPATSSKPTQVGRSAPPRQSGSSKFLDSLTTQLTALLDCADCGSRDTLKQLIHLAMLDVRDAYKTPDFASQGSSSGGTEARAELASCLAKAEADKAILEKKLKAAHSALNAALAV